MGPFDRTALHLRAYRMRRRVHSAMKSPAGTLIGPRGRTVDHDVYVLVPENFERAEQAIALCMAHGLMGPGK